MLAAISGFVLSMGLAAPADELEVVAADKAVLEKASGAVAIEHPDVGLVRYRDPDRFRELWLGLDVGGVALPQGLGLFNRTVWAQRTSGAWALGLTPYLSVGGRHDNVLYDAENIRLQVVEHRLYLSGSPLFARRTGKFRDRLEAGVEVHNVKRSWLEGHLFKFGGLWDTVLTLGYGMEHRLTPRWHLGWNLQGRYAWVFKDNQRQVRASLRPRVILKDRHQLSLEALAFLVHRDEDQFGNPLPRFTVAAQGNFEYQWMSPKQVGPFVRLHYASSFMSGEAPVYEIREEAINTHYGELMVGLRVFW